MGRIRWHKRDHNAALTGMANLSLEERGAYNTILDLIYTHDGALDDDAKFICGWLRCDVRVWKRIRERLLSLGKLYKVGGKLRNERCDLEVDRANSRLNCSIQAGLSSAAKRSDVKSIINGLAPNGVERTLQQPTPRKKESFLLGETSLARSLSGAQRSVDKPLVSEALVRSIEKRGSR